jgi:hypothetical protein
MHLHNPRSAVNVAIPHNGTVDRLALAEATGKDKTEAGK